MDKQIKIIKGDVGLGFRVLCNLSPEELKARKKEVIKNFLENLNFEVDFAINEEGKTPTPSTDVSGFWSYFVKLN